MRQPFASFLIGLLSFAPLAHASTFDALLGDVQMLEESMAVHETEDSMEQMMMQTDGDSELFPLLDGESDDEPERTSAFVQITIDGSLVTLDDVSRVQWFAEYVEDVAARGIISGYKNPRGVPLGKYGPADSVTIEQLAKMVLEAAKINEELCAGTLLNPSAKGNWSEEYIACAEAKGFTVFVDGGVDVERPAKRNEVVVTVLQAFGVGFDSDFTGIFTDVKAGTQFARAIETAASDGIVSGHTDASGNLTGSFGPNNNVNRAEMAKIISLALQAYGD